MLPTLHSQQHSFFLRMHHNMQMAGKAAAQDGPHRIALTWTWWLRRRSKWRRLVQGSGGE